MSDQPDLLPTDYAALLGDIKRRVRHAQTRAMLAFYREYSNLAFVPQPVAQIAIETPAGHL